MIFDIRKINSEDIEQVFTLLIALARHEKIEDRFKLTKEKMRLDLFGPEADWHCFVVTTTSNEIIGFCLFSFANINRSFNHTPLIHIDDIFIKAKYRKYGLGKKLLEAIALVAKNNGIDRIELWCIKDNFLGQAFYQRLGARKLDFLDVYSLDVPALLGEADVINPPPSKGDPL
jgi:ribosomal protein S18 acetylase RimI-like enzyme